MFFKRSCIYSVVLLTAAPLISPGQNKQNDIRDVRDPWFGFAKGSWIVRSERDPFNPKGKPMFFKFVRVDDDSGGRIRLSRRMSTNLTFPKKATTSISHVPGLDPGNDKKSKLIATRKDSLVIDGKKRTCVVKEYRIERVGSVSLWHAKGVDVPYRELTIPGPDIALFSDVVRAECKVNSAKGAGTVAFHVGSLHDPQKIGERKIACVREQFKFDYAVKGGVRGIGSRWISNGVPGRVVRISVNLTDMPAIVARNVKDFYVGK